MSSVPPDPAALAVMSLAKEVWVLGDRLHVIETLLDRHGVVTTAAIDQFSPDEDFKAENDRRRAALTGAVFSALGVSTL